MDTYLFRVDFTLDAPLLVEDQHRVGALHVAAHLHLDIQQSSVRAGWNTRLKPRPPFFQGAK